MKNKVKLSALATLLLFCTVSLSAQESRFFWSFSDLNSGAQQDDFLLIDLLDYTPEETPSLFLYYDPIISDLDTGFDLNISVPDTGVIKFTGAETLNFDIVLASSPTVALGPRWENVGPADEVQDFQITGLRASVGSESFGGLLHDGTQTFLDSGYDFGNDSFLVARVDFVALGDPLKTSIILEAGREGIVHNGQNLMDPPTAEIIASLPVCLGDTGLGDVNLDGVTNLLDVGPFVDRLLDCAYSFQADINFDSRVDLLDVAGFINILSN